MSDQPASINLTNHFLIAMPGMEDSTFSRSVVYVCEHSERGALGIIINKPGAISIADLFDKVDLPLARTDLQAQPVFQGGPVKTEQGFVLHEPILVEGGTSDESLYASTLSVPGGLDMTTSKDVLEALSSGGGPRQVLVTLGYSAWGEGQLESEIAGNSWLTVGADPRLVLEAPVERRYDMALQLLGLEVWMLSPDMGHA